MEITEKQKNCPYCHSGHQPIYEKDNSARLVRINLKGNKKASLLFELCIQRQARKG